MAAGKRIAAARKVLDGRRIGLYGPRNWRRGIRREQILVYKNR
jgi:hypothetical protein